MTCGRCLAGRISEIPGASVEHNTFCVSVHFRNCEEANWEDVQVRPGCHLPVHQPYFTLH